MRVLHLNNADTNNGAARAAYRLHHGLMRQHVDSRMLVAKKYTDDESVVIPNLSRQIFDRLIRRYQRWLVARDERCIARSRASSSVFFSTDQSAFIGLWGQVIQNTDVINLHSAIGLVDYRSFFSVLPPTKPLVWTLHDANPFTGGCINTGGCDKYTVACKACPALNSTDDDDLASKIFSRKRASYEHLSRGTVQLVAPSRWLAAEVKKSALLGQFGIKTIPNGIDIEIFKPRDRTAARDLFGIPPTSKVIMFIAEWIDVHHKGIDLLLEALNGLNVPFDVALISVGGNKLKSGLKLSHLPLGRLESERALSFAYSVADLVVCPSREDNLPSVVLEAMGCGTPVVAFDVGGLSDMVRLNRTGILAPTNNVHALRCGIETLLINDDLRSNMGKESRRIAVEEYSVDLQAQRYQTIYRELLAQARKA